jgi:hypothetical protein
MILDPEDPSELQLLAGFHEAQSLEPIREMCTSLDMGHYLIVVPDPIPAPLPHVPNNS